MTTESRKEFCIDQIESKITLMVESLKEMDLGVATIFYYEATGMIEALFCADIISDIEYETLSDELRMFRDAPEAWKGKFE